MHRRLQKQEPPMRRNVLLDLIEHLVFEVTDQPLRAIAIDVGACSTVFCWFAYLLID